MALTDSDKGKMAADVCIVLILIVASFAAGLLVSSGGLPEGIPFLPNTNPNTNTTGTDTTTDTTTTNTDTTTTTTTLPDPPPDTTYKIYLVLRFTGGETFAVITTGIVVLTLTDGETNDDSWAIVAQAGSNNMTGYSPVKRYTRSGTVGRKIIIAVEDRGWNYDCIIDSTWTRTPDGIGDYLQTTSFGSNLELRIWLSPRWDGS